MGEKISILNQDIKNGMAAHVQIAHEHTSSRTKILHLHEFLCLNFTVS